MNEAKMSDQDAISACKSLVKNGDDKAKKFAQGLLDYHKENNSFHPNQIAGLQNIMKNASYQMAKKD
jgi:capsule polysaccharide export protein KpsE/RkpR